ncbi:MAG: hypothetical protein ACOZE7_07120 [Pseudomonadota bacterium]
MTGKQIPQNTALARDLALVNAEAMSMAEVAARAGRPVEEIIALLDDPELISLVEREAVGGRLNGVTAQAKAAAIRDRALTLLASKVNEGMGVQGLIAVINAVRPIATREESSKGATFSLVINFDGGPKSAHAEVVDVQARDIEGDA